MTSGDTPQQQPTLDDERAVEALLAEAGFSDDPGLRQVLLQLRALRVAEAPEPSGELAALLAGAGTVARLERVMPRRKKRVVFTTIAVAASFGIAGGAAAGNGDFRREAAGSISTVIEWLSPHPPAAPAPAVPPDVPPATQSPSTNDGSIPPEHLPTATVTGQPLPAPHPEQEEVAERPAARSGERQEPVADAPEGPWDAMAERPGATEGQAQRGGKTVEPSLDGAPAQGGDAASPEDTVQDKSSGKGNMERPDKAAPTPTPKARPDQER